MAPPPSEALPFVGEWLIRKNLAEIGVTFSGDEMSLFEVGYLSFINCVYEDLLTKEAKRKQEADKRRR